MIDVGRKIRNFGKKTKEVGQNIEKIEKKTEGK